MGRYRAMVAVAVFVAWLLITVFAGRIWLPVHGHEPLTSGIARSVEPALIAAVLFLFVVIWAFRWRDVGLNPPRAAGTMRLLVFPALYIVGFVALGAASGLPSGTVLLIILANTLLVGVSEEQACRGILYQGLRSQLSLWSAILGSSVLFGAAHLFNGFTTGDFGAAATQALTAFMTGIAFMAIRLRTGSLYPGMALHAVWDFALVAVAAGVVRSTDMEAGSGGLQGLPLLFILPNFLYGLYLMRNAARDEPRAAV